MPWWYLKQDRRKRVISLALAAAIVSYVATALIAEPLRVFASPSQAEIQP